MSINKSIDPAKKAKNIAAVLYLLVLAFLVGGSYLHQQQTAGEGQGPFISTE